VKLLTVVCLHSTAFLRCQDIIYRTEKIKNGFLSKDLFFQTSWLLIIQPNKSYWHWLPPKLLAASPLAWESHSWPWGQSWLMGEIFRWDCSVIDKGAQLSESKWVHLCQTLHALPKPRGFKEVILHMGTRHPSPYRHLWQKRNSYFWPRPSV
jgi:hypothetical protein